jgi:DNA ligase-1
MKTFPTLYKKSSTGADQRWDIAVDGATIITRWGQVDGAIQETRDTIKEGKNQGKKNATTAEQQAELEAEATYTKKLKKSYVTTLKAARAGKVSDLIKGGHFPMLADKFRDHGDKVTYPVYVQPKFDGHRCITTVISGVATMWTRTRKPITGLPHIIKAVEAACLKAGITDINLDGELYNHEYRSNFEALSSFIRTPEPKEGHEIVQYHVYDLVELSAGFEQRNFQILGLHLQLPLVPVVTLLAADEDEVRDIFEVFLKQGYEGLMVRTPAGLYVSHPTHRSRDLLKVKKFDDAEFRVIGVEEGRGKMAGRAIFICEHEGRPFKAKMRGKLEDLEKYVKNPDLAVDKMLTVEYFGISNKNKVPRFPVGARFAQAL